MSAQGQTCPTCGHEAHTKACRRRVKRDGFQNARCGCGGPHWPHKPASHPTRAEDETDPEVLFWAAIRSVEYPSSPEEAQQNDRIAQGYLDKIMRLWRGRRSTR